MVSYITTQYVDQSSTYINSSMHIYLHAGSNAGWSLQTVSTQKSRFFALSPSRLSLCTESFTPPSDFKAISNAVFHSYAPRSLSQSLSTQALHAASMQLASHITLFNTTVFNASILSQVVMLKSQHTARSKFSVSFFHKHVEAKCSLKQRSLKQRSLTYQSSSIYISRQY